MQIKRLFKHQSNHHRSAGLLGQCVTPSGHKLLLANKRNRAIEMKLPDAAKATGLTVDESTGDEPAHSVKPANGQMKLQPFAVTVVSWK